MAKIRIYELARNLNMENKALLEKIDEMGVDVKGHMSSLEEETAAQIRANILGKKAETVEETRVKPTVIRRRKRQIEEEPVQADAVSEPKTPLEAAEAQASEKAAVDEGVLPKVKKPKKPAKKEKGETEAVGPAEPTPKKPAELKKKKPAKIVKKVKKETPAKIIKLPVKPIAKEAKLEPAPEEKKEKVKVKAKYRKKPPKLEPETILPEKVKPGKGKPKKRERKTPEENLRDARFFKKKISFRRKEVIEGADLYVKGRRGRKVRKGLKVTTAKGQKPQLTIPKAIKRRIKIDETIALTDLAKRMGIKSNEMITKLMSLGVIATVNQTIDFETAVLVAAEFEYELEKATFEEETVFKVEEDAPGQLVERPPVVTIMGHVDHGKTSLLDAIRKTKVTELEAGGITQHIGAYHVSTDKGQVVFLDTPGHEAFTAMRSRGAKITDIVILVVAADDGVMPQTVEAINHSKAANVPIIVAVNKIDKQEADPERVKRELADYDLTPEDWGGDTIYIDVSAKTHEGLDEFLELILLQSEVLELKANPDRLAVGHVVEARLDSGRGAIATVLVQNGTLRTGDHIVCGVHYGKVRAMMNDRGVRVESAGPSIPVEVIGLSGVPLAGDELITLSDEKDAKQISLHRSQKQRSKDLAKSSRLSLDKLYESLQAGKVNDLHLLIKADVDGSIEVLRDSLTKLSNEEVNINVIHSATGTVTESDVSLAAVSHAIIIGFNVRPSRKVRDRAADEDVEMNFYNVIYDVIKDVKDAIVGMMSSTFEEHTLGLAEVRDVFHIPKVGTIAGCYITDGKIERGRQARLIRDGVVGYEGKIASLRRFKDDAKEVQSGYECGIGIENYNDIKIGDVIECYYVEEIKPELV